MNASIERLIEYSKTIEGTLQRVIPIDSKVIGIHQEKWEGINIQFESHAIRINGLVVTKNITYHELEAGVSFTSMDEMIDTEMRRIDFEGINELTLQPLTVEKVYLLTKRATAKLEVNSNSSIDIEIIHLFRPVIRNQLLKFEMFHQPEIATIPKYMGSYKAAILRRKLHKKILNQLKFIEFELPDIGYSNGLILPMLKSLHINNSVLSMFSRSSRIHNYGNSGKGIEAGMYLKIPISLMFDFISQIISEVNSKVELTSHLKLNSNGIEYEVKFEDESRKCAHIWVLGARVSKCGDIDVNFKIFFDFRLQKSQGELKALLIKGRLKDDSDIDIDDDIVSELYDKIEKKLEEVLSSRIEQIYDDMPTRKTINIETGNFWVNKVHQNNKNKVFELFIN